MVMKQKFFKEIVCSFLVVVQIITAATVALSPTRAEAASGACGVFFDKLARGAVFVARNARPSVLFHHTLDFAKIDALTAANQDPATFEKFKQDLQKRAFNDKYTPEEIFAYVELAFPVQGKQVVEDLKRAHDGANILNSPRGVWASRRWHLTEVFARSNVKFKNGIFVKLFSLPPGISDAQFEEVITYVLLYAAEANLLDPDMVAVLKAIRARSMTGVFEQRAFYRKFTSDFFAAMKDSPTKTKAQEAFLNMSDEEKAVLNKGDEKAYLEYLKTHQTKTVIWQWVKATAWQGFRIWAIYGLGQSLWLIWQALFPDDKHKHQAVGSGNDGVADDIKDANTEMDLEIKRDGEDPFDPKFTEDVLVDENNPSGPHKANPCDPQHFIRDMIDNVILKSSKPLSTIESVTDELVAQKNYKTELLPDARKSLKKYWLSSHSDCRAYYFKANPDAF